ncbi:unnamed protein product [Rotaria magnacalcarata]
MRKIVRSVKVGFIRRGSIPTEGNDYETSSDLELQSHREPTNNQRFQKRISQSARNQAEVHEEKPPVKYGTTKAIRLHHVEEPNNGHQPHSNMSNSTMPSSFSQQKNYNTTVGAPSDVGKSSLNEIGTTSKWSMRKKVLVGSTVALSIAAVITITVVLSILLTKPTGSTSTTTASSVVVSAYWTFDGTTADSYGVYGGQLVNGTLYTSASATNMPYVGIGQALDLTQTPLNSFLVSSPFFNLNGTSFTIEAWIYLKASSSDRGIFGQCSCSSCADQCLYLIIRNNRLYVDFTSNYLSGSTILYNSTWYHIAFVYNYGTQQQILYVNGVQDAIKSNAQPYQGQSGNITIGSSTVSSTQIYFSGYIDNLLLTTQAKSSTDLLSDASLAAYYSFDSPSSNADSGPNGIDGSAINTLSVTGRVNQGIYFYPSITSYFHAYGFYQIPDGVITNKQFSFALWINPSSTSSSTIIQTFSTTYGLCKTLLGFYSYGTSGGQIFAVCNGASPLGLTGPFITQNTWTHVSLTYSLSNGYTLYVNGVLFGSTGYVASVSSGTLAHLFIGYYSACCLGTFSYNYQGSIDELYVYNRELSQSEVAKLANP